MADSDRDERELVDEASQGDLDAIEQLMARHLPALEGFVRKRGVGLPKHKESAVDLVQSVCREVLEDVQTERFEYRGEKQFRAWMYEAALLKIKDRRRYWRAERRDPGRERRPAQGGESGAIEDALPPRGTTPSHEVARGEEVENTRRLLEQLPERYKQIIELAHIEELSHREIAERLEITEGASRMLLSRALARLATLAAEYE